MFIQIGDGDIGAFPGKQMATARPMPESPPVISATLFSSFLEPR